MVIWTKLSLELGWGLFGLCLGLQSYPPSPLYTPGDLKDPEEAHTSEHRDAQGLHGAHLHQGGLQDAPTDHKAVKAVEEGGNVGGGAQTIQLEKHLQGEQTEQHFVGILCGERGGATRLASLHGDMWGGSGHGVIWGSWYCRSGTGWGWG